LTRPAKGGLDAKLEKLRALRDADADVRIPALRRALADASNYLIAKAAELAADRGDAGLIPDLLAAYDTRFGDDAVARDPQVWAKVAIARALRTLGHRDPAPFVRGLHHVQLEPVWGKLVDMAPNLRCACAQALVDTDLAPPDALRELVQHLVDPFPVVRVEAVTAVAQIGGHEAALLLRLKAHAGDDEPEVLGACFAALVEREGAAGVAFVVPFLDDDDDAVKAEAAAALALSRDPAAIELLRAFVQRPLPADVRATAVAACAGCPQPAVVDLLLDVVAGRERGLAEHAVRALGASRFRDAVRDRARDAVVATRRDDLMALYDDAFGPAPHD
jgi:HEAT repeat protein